MDVSIQVGISLKGIGSFVHGDKVDEGMKKKGMNGRKGSIEWKQQKG